MARSIVSEKKRSGNWLRSGVLEAATAVCQWNKNLGPNGATQISVFHRGKLYTAWKEGMPDETQCEGLKLIGRPWNTEEHGFLVGERFDQTGGNRYPSVFDGKGVLLYLRKLKRLAPGLEFKDYAEPGRKVLSKALDAGPEAGGRKHDLLRVQAALVEETLEKVRNDQLKNGTPQTEPDLFRPTMESLGKLLNLGEPEQKILGDVHRSISLQLTTPLTGPLEQVRCPPLANIQVVCKPETMRNFLVENGLIKAVTHPDSSSTGGQGTKNETPCL